MKFKLEIRQAAEQEFNDAADWYYLEDPVASDRFVIAIERSLAAIKRNPTSYPVVYGSQIRRAVVGKFPFCIFFTAADEAIIVLSIFHNSRDPMVWKGRID
ncbi:MAG: type II toxin-antitoxin system RelE/ParE family toxin [Pyrinomonadaceae bacterium]